MPGICKGNTKVAANLRGCCAGPSYRGLSQALLSLEEGRTISHKGTNVGRGDDSSWLTHVVCIPYCTLPLSLQLEALPDWVSLGWALPCTAFITYSTSMVVTTLAFTIC